MKIKSVHYNFNHTQVSSINFFSTDTFLDADILLLNFKGIAREIYDYYASLDPSGNYFLNAETFLDIQNAIESRSNELTEFFDNGRTLIIETSSLSQIDIVVQGMGKQTIDFFKIISTYIEKPVFTETKGENVSLSENKLLSNFQLKENLIWTFNFKFDSKAGLPLLYINKTTYSVSKLFSLLHGNIIYLPELRTDHPAYINLFVDQLPKFILTLPRIVQDEQVPLPVWTDQIHLIGETEHLKSLNELKDRLSEITQSIHDQQQVYDNVRNLKWLFAGTGSELEKSVSYIFKEFGFEFKTTEAFRDDLIIAIDNKIGVVEIKGTKGSASEKYAAQLNKWVSTYHYDNDILPKGILIVNGFNATPINSRSRVFPEQMLSFSRQREHCLITGIELLSMYLDFKSNLISQSEIVTLIFETNGEINYTSKNPQNIIGF